MRQIAIIFLFLITLTSCRDDFEDLNISTSESTPSITLGDQTASARGRIVDNDGRPVAGARISSNFNEATLSDDDGFYELLDFRIGMDGDNFFFIRKDGYFEEFRKFTPNNKSVHLIDIVLNIRQPQGQINAVTGGTFTIPGGPTLRIPAGAARSGSSDYTGMINVTMYYDDPASMTSIAQSAANLPAWGNNSQVELATFGMVQLELRGENNESIGFPTQQPASLEFPIPPSLEQATVSGDSLLFWQLEEIAWGLLSSPLIRGGTIRANIRGGGVYNCDVPYPRAKICGRLVSPDGLPLVNQAFTIAIDGGAFMFTFRTDNRGEFCASVARDQILSILIPDPCNPDEVLTEFVIGPYPEGPTDIGDLELDLSFNSVQIAVTNCSDGSPATDDDAILWISGFGRGLPFLLNDGGLAQLPLPDCNNETFFHVQAVGHDGRTTSELAAVSAESPTLTTLTLCDELAEDEYFTVSIDGAPELAMTRGSYLFRQVTNGNIAHQFWGEHRSGTDTTEFFLSLPALEVGTYNQPEAIALGYGYQPGLSFSYFCADPCPSSEIVITATGPNDSWVAGTFSYLAQQVSFGSGDPIATDLPITGTFRLNR
ncbi:MAG: carboxypeptidase-like regulatory domain-containing protein [Bacteroidota bacterium]